MNCRLGEHNITWEVKSQRKGYAKCNQESADIRTDGEPWEVNHLLMQNVVKGNIEDKYVQQGIPSAACKVSEALFVEPSAKWLVNQVQYWLDPLFDHDGACKIRAKIPDSQTNSIAYLIFKGSGDPR